MPAKKKPARRAHVAARRPNPRRAAPPAPAEDLNADEVLQDAFKVLRQAHSILGEALATVAAPAPAPAAPTPAAAPIAPAIAPEVLSMVDMFATETLRAWLRHIGAPAAALTLLEAVTVFAYSAGCAAGPREHSEAMNAFEAELLPAALSAVAELGGSWELRGIYTHPRPMPGLTPAAGPDLAAVS